MSQTNASILQNYFDEVINQKHLDLFSKYFDDNFIRHGSQYVGMGVMTDSSSGSKVVVQKVNPSGPAANKLIEGDEILRVKSDGRTFDTFEELRNGMLWGQGVIGTSLTVVVRRDGVEREILITRGLVPAFEFPNEMQEPGMRMFFEEMPDVKAQLVEEIEVGDTVAFRAEFQGSNVNYGRSAVWSEFGFVRFKDGKMTDWWNSDEEVSTIRQLGFSITAPELVKVQ